MDLLIVDLHIHTRSGSMDSIMSAGEASARAVERGLDGVVFSEHSRHWIPEEANAFGAREYSTAFGHIIAIGDLPTDHTPSVEDLYEHFQHHDGVLILAHPFRYLRAGGNLLYAQSVQHSDVNLLARHSAFDLVDAVEALNGGCTREENELALAVTRYAGLAAVGGSDAHAPGEVGHCATAFPGTMRCIEDIVAVIKEGACAPVARTNGRFEAFDV